jgi:hypothetical protein
MPEDLGADADVSNVDQDAWLEPYPLEGVDILVVRQLVVRAGGVVVLWPT